MASVNATTISTPLLAEKFAYIQRSRSEPDKIKLYRHGYGHKSFYVTQVGGQAQLESVHCWAPLFRPSEHTKQIKQELLRFLEHVKFGHRANIQENNPVVNSPETIRHWKVRSLNRVTDGSSALTLILDLDDTIVKASTFGDRETRFSKEFVLAYNGFKGFFDEEAMKKIADFQTRGHRVMVMTHASYEYQYVKRAFKHFGIDLPEENYFEITTFLMFNTNKKKVIDGQFSSRFYLLADDLEENKPKKTYFHHIKPNSRFDVFEPEVEL